MSFVKNKSFLEKIRSTKSLKGFSFNFLLRNMAGQKIFLYNQKIPRVINISFNEKTCMFKCIMCPFGDKDVRELYASGSEMNFDTLKNIVNSVPNDPYHSFDISAIGETLSFKSLPEFISYMKEKKPLVNTIISTNGILLTESLFRQLVKSGLDSIQISLYAGDQEEHRHITGTKTYNRVCNNIIMISKIKKELGTQKPFLQTFMMGCKENQDSFDHFIDYWSRYVEKPFIRPIYNLGRPIEGMTPLFNRTATKDRYPCITPWYSTAIRSNGDVLPCYMYHWYKESKDQVIGNINQDSIMDIWRSDKFTMFRQAHLSLQLNDYPLCQKCDLWDAYTNVWSKKRDGIFYYKHASIKDLFIKAPQHRGG